MTDKPFVVVAIEQTSPEGDVRFRHKAKKPDDPLDTSWKAVGRFETHDEAIIAAAELDIATAGQEITYETWAEQYRDVWDPAWLEGDE